MNEPQEASLFPSEAVDRIALLEQRIHSLERQVVPVQLRWNSVRAILRIFVLCALAISAVIALLLISSLHADLSFPLLLLGLWATAIVLWAAVEVLAFRRWRFTLSTMLAVVFVASVAFASWRTYVLNPYL